MVCVGLLERLIAIFSFVKIIFLSKIIDVDARLIFQFFSATQNYEADFQPFFATQSYEADFSAFFLDHLFRPCSGPPFSTLFRTTLLDSRGYSALVGSSNNAPDSDPWQCHGLPS